MIATIPALLGITLIVFSIYGSNVYSLESIVPIAGSGVLFGALAIILIFAGVICELIYKTGNIKTNKLPLLTAEVSFTEKDNRKR